MQGIVKAATQESQVGPSGDELAVRAVQDRSEPRRRFSEEEIANLVPRMNMLNFEPYQ